MNELFENLWFGLFVFCLLASWFASTQLSWISCLGISMGSLIISLLYRILGKPPS